jgi:tetratricopeptide (TPR) repeat protein
MFFLEKKTMSETKNISIRLDHATDLNNLALLYYGQGRYAEAEPLCRQAVEIRVASLSRQHPDTQTMIRTIRDV